MNASAPKTTTLAMPPMLYGTAWKRERTVELVKTALEQGFRGVDTACQPKHYDEPGVGAALAAASEGGVRRAEIFLQTKFTPIGGHDPQRIPYDPRAPLASQVEQSFAVSLSNLRTDYLDSLVLHSPLGTLQETREVWRAMETLVDRGGVHRIGISNCYDVDLLRTLHDTARIKPSVVQNRFYAQTDYDTAIRQLCKQRGTTYQSFWTLTANPHLLAHPHLQAIAAAHRRTPAQVLFRFLMHAGVVPLTGTKTIAHMRDDLSISEFELNAAERASIDALLL